VRAARREGRRVWAETCPHYLGFSDDRYEGDFSQALKYAMDPPLKKQTDAEALWEGLFDGTISTVATDHCAFPWAEKKALTQGNNIFNAPWGIPGVETRLPFLYSEGVVKRGLSVERFVDLVSTAPARLFGLARKGRLEVGYEADVVIFDPAAEKTVTPESLHQTVDFTPFENMVMRGWPKLVFSRGRKIVDGERFLGEPGQGRFVARRPFSEMRQK
jgi:dihydropyrimidinase